MAKLNNVKAECITIGNKEKDILKTFNVFLKRKGQDSLNTQKTYERAVRDFFLTMRDKKVEDLVEEDLFFTKGQIENYATELRDKFKTKTVNGTMSALREFYKKLRDDNFDVDKSCFDIGRYKEYDVDKYDSLSHEEILDIINIVSKTRLGSSKALLVRLAYATAFRKESLLELTWDDIKTFDGVHFIKTIGKGNKESFKKLSDSLYKALMEEKEKSTSQNIIPISSKTVQRMMDYIRENMDFGDRNIVFHSFKKASIREVALLSGGDIKAMQAQGDHSNAQTMIDYYLDEKKKEDLITVDVDCKLDFDVFDELSHEELLSLIKSMDRTTKVKILIELNKKKA